MADNLFFSVIEDDEGFFFGWRAIEA
jgi:hypothetical protein